MRSLAVLLCAVSHLRSSSECIIVKLITQVARTSLRNFDAQLWHSSLMLHGFEDYVLTSMARVLFLLILHETHVRRMPKFPLF